MCRAANLVLAAALLVATAKAAGGGEQGQTPPKPLIDCTDDELSQRVPSLNGVRFDRSPEFLHATLSSLGKALDTSMETFVDVSAQEEILELRLENGARVDAKREEFRHVIHLPTDHPAGAGEGRLREFRIAEKDKRIAKAGGEGMFVVSRFMNLLEFLLGENQKLSRFRAVGRMGSGGSESVVLVYAYLAGSSLDSGLVAATGAAAELMQGVVWVGANTGWPQRVLAEPLRSLAGNGMDELRTELVTAPVKFASTESTLLLPLLVTTHAGKAMVHTYAVHKLTGYRMFGVDADGDPEAEKQYSGVTPALPASSDAYECLARGVTLRMEKKESEAIAPLREAVRLDANLVAARLELGLALDGTGDSAGAETELRETSRQFGGSAPVHHALGVMLYLRGSVREASIEFREAIRLAPNIPAAHTNLAMALEKLGDVKGATEQLQAALQLDPGNAAVKNMLDQLRKAPAAGKQPAEEAVPTIRVDVRQVVVPVVILDKDGRHVSGLKQADFRVLEDGAEQTITAFHVETSGTIPDEAEPKPVAPLATESTLTAAVSKAPPVIRHTYVICIDTLHTQFGNLHYLREALQKFFQSERAGDSQYAVIAIGQAVNVVLNLTRDPASALASLDDKSFVKMAGGSQVSNWRGEIRRFTTELNEIRAQVDSPDRMTHEMGVTRMNALPAEAEALAGMDRSYTVTVLAQVRALVSQLAQGKEHRTLLLCSDGFQLVPGREVWGLLVAYFPELNRYALRTVERLSGEFDAIVKVAAKSNIIIDTIDSRGLYTSSYFDASNTMPSASVAPRVLSETDSAQSTAGDSLMELAAATGGTAYFNSNDIYAGIRKAVAEGRDYYTLAYVPANSAMDGKYRKIAVEVKGRKLTVKAKRGYWATEN